MTTPPFDIAAFVVEHASTPPSEPTKPARGTPASASSTPAVASQAMPGDLSDDAERIYRAVRYLDNIAPAVAGQGGHDQTFDAACALVVEFGLSKEQARPILETWNQRCVPPWSPSELDHKLNDADAKGGPRGRLFEVKKSSPVPAVAGSPGQLVEPNVGPAVSEGQEDNPHRLASWFLRSEHNHAEGYSLRFWQDEFHAWKDGAYHPVSSKEIRGRLAKWLASELHRVYVNQLVAKGMSEDKERKPRLIPVTTNLTGHVAQAISGDCLLPYAAHPSQPCWLDGHPGWSVAEIIPTKNAIVHVPSYLSGEHCTRPPTPLLFSPFSLGYDWQPDAPKPERFLKFLAETWPDDPQSIETLQEWYGLQLVPVTSYEKMLALIGPPRAGKGVIAAIMREMVGPANCCGPTLSGLAETFGMQSLIGKLSAIIDDARLSGKSDQAIITERLLSISGQGCLDVRRMHRPQWTGVLTCRITLISNELPRLNDNANALANRFIVLKFTKSHLGSEDNSLKSTLLKEMPGILLWSLEGLRRLNERGHFVQPDSGRDIHEEMEEMSSPIGSFVKDCLSLDSEGTATKEDLYRAWRHWCEQNGRREAGELSVFCRNLRSVVPNLKAAQKREGARRFRFFQGVSLLTPVGMFGPTPDLEESGGFIDVNGVPF